MSSEPVDLAIVGAGIIGLATAHRYIAKHPGQSVLILERESGFAHHQTGRNSGVLHSGIYYAPGSMKAELAVAGRSAMVDFCQERGIDHEVCGKVIVATRDDEIERLRALSGRAKLNGLSAELIDAGRLTEIEPHCNGIEALYVPSTGIVSYSKVCEALRIEIEESGGSVRFDTSVLNVEESEVGARISTSGGEVFARFLVNCAGLRCDQVAGMVDAAEGNRTTTSSSFRELRNGSSRGADRDVALLGTHDLVTQRIHGRARFFFFSSDRKCCRTTPKKYARHR